MLMLKIKKSLSAMLNALVDPFRSVPGPSSDKRVDDTSGDAGQNCLKSGESDVSYRTINIKNIFY